MSQPFAIRPATRDSARAYEEARRRPLMILAAYLTLMLAPMTRWTLQSGSYTGEILHLCALGIVAMAYFGHLPMPMRDWTPLALGPFLYIELRWLVTGAGRPHADDMVRQWEAVVFPTHPSATLAAEWHSAALSELLHICYLSYYALIFVPPIVIWLARRQTAFSATILALTVVYALCFATYVVFPVDGPRFLHGPANAPQGPVRALVVALLASGSSRGTAFPSSHVAASLVASVCAIRFQRRLGIVISVLTAGVCVGAVYGGYHYAIDIVGGLVIGALALGIARSLETRHDAVAEGTCKP